MDPQTLAYRAEISRRLKAARWLAGDVRESTKGNGWEAIALTPEELAQRAPLPANQITANKLGTIERMERHTPPMELAAIAEALGLQADWFSVDATAKRVDALDLLTRALADLGLAPGPSQGATLEDERGTDRPDEDGAADVA